MISRVAEKSPLTRIMQRFDTLVLLRQYQRFAEEAAREEERLCCGLVFPWPYLDQYGMVVHNWAAGVDLPGVRIVAVDADGTRLIMEPLKVLLATLDRNSPGKRWRP